MLTSGTSEGFEEIAMPELQEIFGKLVSEEDIKKALGPSITAEKFAEDILGFEEVDENEGDEDEDAMDGGIDNFAESAGATQQKLGVIQEEP